MNKEISMGEARRRAVNGNGLLLPDKRLVAPNGTPLIDPSKAVQAAQPKHYGVVLLENGAVMRQTPVHDPFVLVEIRVTGWRKAWQVLRGQYRVEVQVHGDEDAMRAVFGPSVAIQR